MHACVAGKVHSKGGHVQVGAPLDGRNLGACEGLLLRACGDGQSYTVVLTQGAGTPSDSAPVPAIMHACMLSCYSLDGLCVRCSARDAMHCSASKPARQCRNLPGSCIFVLVIRSPLLPPTQIPDTALYLFMVENRGRTGACGALHHAAGLPQLPAALLGLPLRRRR
jgi:hypothetical protein